MDFVRNLKAFDRNKFLMKINFEEIPAAINIASCVLPHTSARIYIKISIQYPDQTIWNYLKETTINSNNKNRCIFIPESLIP
jgi:hypothetical protein